MMARKNDAMRSMDIACVVVYWLRLIQSIRNKMERLHYPIVRDARSFKRDWNRSPEGGSLQLGAERPQTCSTIWASARKKVLVNRLGGCYRSTVPGKGNVGVSRPVETSGSIGFGVHGRF